MPAPRPPVPALRRVLRTVLLAALALVVGWWTLAFLLQRSMLFPRGHARTLEAARDAFPGRVELGLDVPEGRVEAWFLPAPGATAARPAGAVVFLHGNAELIDHQAEIVRAYHALGLGVLLPEYRGYGRSAGSPSEAALLEDARAFLERLLARPDVDPARIVHHGRSIGTGVACALAAHRAPAALVLESPFRSVTALAARLAVPAFLVRDPFDNEAVLRTLDAPVLLIHGRADTVVPHEHSVALQALARRATLVSHDGGHNDPPPEPPGRWGRIEAFLREAGVLR